MQRPGPRRLAASITALLLAGPASAEYALTVEVRNLEPQTGRVSVSLFDAKRDWMRRPSQSATAPVQDQSTLVFNFSGLEAGDYAVSVVYDVNANGELDTGFLRIPQEPLGFSSNARGRFGPPGWRAVRFELEGDTRIEIRVAAVGEDDDIAD